MDLNEIGSQLADFNLSKTLGGVEAGNEINLPEDVRDFVQDLPYWNKEVDALWLQNPKEKDNARKLGYSFVVKVKTDSSGFYLNNKKVLSWTEEYVFKKDNVIFGSTKGYCWRFAEDSIAITLGAKLETLQQIIFSDLEKLRALVEPAQQAIILEAIKAFTSWETERGVYVCHFKDSIENLFTDYLTVGTVNSNGLYVNGNLIVSWNDFIPRIEGELFYIVHKTAIANAGEDPLLLDAVRYQIGADKKTITRITLGTSVEGLVYLFGYLQQSVPLFHESKGELKERYRTLERSDDVTVKSKTLEYKEIGGFFAKEKYFANINLWARKMSSGIEILFFLDCFSLNYSGDQVSAGEILQMGNGTLKIDLDRGSDSIVFDNAFQSSIDNEEEVLVYLLGKRLLRKIAKAKKIKIILSCRVEVTLEANQLAQIARDFDKEIFDAPQHEYDYYDAEEYWEKKDTFSAARCILKAIEGCPNEVYYSYRKKDFFLGVFISISDELTAIKELVSKKQFKEVNDKIKSLDAKLDEDLRTHLVNHEFTNISIKEKFSEFDKVKAEIKELESKDLYEKAQSAMSSSNFEACERYINEALGLFQAPEYIKFKEELIKKWVPELKKQADGLYSSGNLPGTLKCLEKAVQLMPDDAALKKQRDDLKAEREAKNKERGKHFLIGLGVIIALFVIAWGLIGMLRSTDDSDYDDSVIVEEPASVDSEEEIPNQVVEESTPELSNRNTADLKMFQLKGSVKQVCWDDSYYQLDHRRCGFFSPRLLAYRKNGEISAIYYESYSYDFEHNSNRMVYSYARGGDDYSIDRDTQGRIINIIDYDGNSNLLMWNENGLLVKDYYDYHVEYDDNDQIIMLWSDNDVYRFEYTKFDDHGNWTERVSNLGEVETRSISYYGEPDNPSSLKVVVDAGNLPMYLGPGVTYKRLQDENQNEIHLQSGEKYTYLGELDGFYLIDYNGHEVYVDGKFAHMD